MLEAWWVAIRNGVKLPTVTMVVEADDSVGVFALEQIGDKRGSQ